MLVEAYVYVLDMTVIFSVDVVLGTLENSFIKQQTKDLKCGNTSARVDLGNAGNVIACSRACSSVNECRGFHFNEDDGACWGSNQTECQTVSDTLFYRKESHPYKQPNATADPECVSYGNCTSPTDCGAPPAIPNVDVSTGGTLEGDTRTFSCSPGYALRKAVTMDTTWQPNGTWSSPSFDCLSDCGAPPSVENGVVSGGDTVLGTIRTYTCDTLYAVNGTATVTCQTGATWSAVAFSCVPDCGAPPAIPNVDVSTGGTLEGDTRTFSCSPGYVPRNVVTMNTTCQSDSTWSAPSFDCLSDCGAPPSVENTAVSGGDTVLGTIRTYTCDTLYAVNGTATVTCQTGATWSAVAFSCVQETCPAGWTKMAYSCYKVSDTLTIGKYDVMAYCNNTYPMYTTRGDRKVRGQMLLLSPILSEQRAYCNNTYPTYNTYMLQLETQEENDAVVAFLQTYYSGSIYCLGLHDPLHNNVWEWMATTNPFVYENWSPGQPNQSYEVHAAIFVADNYQWRDYGISLCTPVCEIGLPH